MHSVVHMSNKREEEQHGIFHGSLWRAGQLEMGQRCLGFDLNIPTEENGVYPGEKVS